MSLVEVTVNGPVATITLADVERRNVLSSGLLAELTSAIDECESNAHVRVVVVTNAGRVFCAGADLADPGATPAALAALLARVQRSALPFVGRVNGHCVAGGVGLAAVMDVSVALEGTSFGFTEVRVGVAPAVISVVCLPKMRRGDALEAFVRGRRFDAAEAVRLGLITSCAAADALDAVVGAVVDDLLAGEPTAIAEAKRLVYDVPGLSIDDAFAHTSEVSARLFASDPAREGMAAYLEKRAAPWVERAP